MSKWRPFCSRDGGNEFRVRIGEQTLQHVKSPYRESTDESPEANRLEFGAHSMDKTQLA